jgi:hypothetical protein
MSDREDELIDWLENNKLKKAGDFAPILAEAGIDVEKLEQITDKVQIEALKDVLTRLVVQITVSKLSGRNQNERHQNFGSGRRDQRIFVYGSGGGAGD